MHIVGAGLSGLIAANLLRDHHPTIIEKQKELPNNHSAILRFRQSIVGDVTRIPFRKVQMIKCTLPWRNPVADMLAYSNKTLGILLSDRSITNRPVIEERWIAPDDLIAKLAANCHIEFGHEENFNADTHTTLISTIPMPLLMELLEYPRRTKIEFAYSPGHDLRGKINGKCDAYVSIQNPNPMDAWSRVSITGDDLIIEGSKSLNSGSLPEVAYALGLTGHYFSEMTVHEKRFAKIAPIDEGERQRFIAWATDNRNIYSLGRYATWRPKLLLDDIVQDIRLIENWIVREDRYHLNQKRGG